MTMPGGSPPEGSLVEGSHFSQDIPNSQDGVMALVKGQTTVPWRGAQNSFRFNIQQPLDEQLTIINNHEYRLSATEEAVRQSILQGEAVAFESSGWWKPPRNLVYAELIGIGGGGSGAAGKWNLNASAARWGCGGGGGGETHLDGITRIYAEFLPKTGDDYDWVRVDMYLTGPPGSSSGAAGMGGGNIIFGANLPQPIVTFFGGNGGLNGDTGGGGAGGAGMIRGGSGGAPDGPGGSNGGNSASPYSFAGGGGGGGAGWISSGSGAPGYGGAGVSTAGGAPGQPGVSTNRIIAAGASGGGGARNENEPGGAGGFPGGGGGGGWGGIAKASNGGKGGEAKLWVIETKNEAA